MKKIFLPIIILFAAIIAPGTNIFVPHAFSEETNTIEIVSYFDEEKGLVSNRIYALSPEAPGKGWGVFIASGAGLHIYIDDVFLSVFQGRATTRLATEYGEMKETLWAYAAGNKQRGDLLYRIISESGLWTAERTAPPTGTVACLSARHKTLYIGTDHSLLYIEEIELNGEVKYKEILTDVSITAALALGDGTLALGLMDKESKKMGLKIIGGEMSGHTGWVENLSGHEVTALHKIDLIDGGLLVGTKSSGLFLLDKKGVRKIPASVKLKNINDILFDNSSLYAATDSGLFIGKISTLATLTRYKVTDKSTKATALAPGPGSLVWVGTESGGLYLISYDGKK
jgi:hypothetical protein